jgi:hypothetical protein
MYKSPLIDNGHRNNFMELGILFFVIDLGLFYSATFDSSASFPRSCVSSSVHRYRSMLESESAFTDLLYNWKNFLIPWLLGSS